MGRGSGGETCEEGEMCKRGWREEGGTEGEGRGR